MLRNLFIASFRNLRKNLSYTIINVIGLSVGMACCLATYTIVSFENSFDNWHEKKDQIFRYTNIYQESGKILKNGIVPYPTGDLLRNSIPEIEKVVPFHGPMDYKFSYLDKQNELQIFREESVLMTDQMFFEVLDFEVISGNPYTLNEPNKVFLSEKLAKKYFDLQDPIGKALSVEVEGKTISVEVAGIVEDSPQNTNLPYSCLLSIATLRQLEPDIFSTWTMTWAYTNYVQVKKGADLALLNEKIDRVVDGARNHSKEQSEKTQVVLQPLSEIHTDEAYGGGYNYIIPSILIWAFTLLAVLILGTGCLNFVNLSTALAIKRSKEIGLRKVLGSSRKILIIQFLIETFQITLLSMIIALSMAPFLLDQFAIFVSNGYAMVFSQELIITILLLVLFVTIAAGFYPSIVLSGYKPIEAIKNKITLQKGAGSFNLRKSLVVIQFALTTIMIVSTLIISAQVDHMKARDMGFDPTNVFLIQVPNESTVDPKSFMSALKNESFVSSASLAFTAPSAWWNQVASYSLVGSSSESGDNNANMKFIDANYLSFYDIPLIAGKNIKEAYLSDSTFDAVVTRNLVASVGLEHPEEILGKTLSVGGERIQYRIIGVTEDFITSSSHEDASPTILAYDPSVMKNVAIKLPDENLERYLSDIEEAYRTHYPNELFEYSMLSSEIEQRYSLENSLKVAINFVSIIVILLATIGLYGLVSFIANKSAKSIGIRKVFGASVPHILASFTKEYVVLLLIAFVISCPAIFYLMSAWMENFASRIPISAVYFLSGFCISLLIALLTAGYRSWIAARANPILSLRYE